MIPELGHFALALGCVLAFVQAILPLWGAHRRDARLMAAGPALAIGQLLALAASFAALVWSGVVDDYTVLNIANNNNSFEPLVYKITGTWGNHEGSILLWGLVLSVCGGAVAIFGRGLPSALRARVLAVLGGTSCGFLLFALLASDPFQRLWPPPMDGHDINPLLQDPGLAFHPPILYAGYVGFAVPFAFAVAALIEGRIDAAWGRWVRPWTLVSWCFLTCGIAMGSWWAYYELGWGGYWFWDPVENASLLPWLTGTALLHSAIVVEKRESLRVWTVLLAIGTFALSLSGTFMVRSGILNSVHAFASDPTRGVFILGLLGVIIGGSLLLFAFRAPRIAGSGAFAPISREGSLVVNNILLCSIAAVVFTGTTYPVFAQLLGTQISVGAPFFHLTVIPLAIPLMLAMSVGPLLPWKRAQLGPALIRLWWAALAGLIIGLFVALHAEALTALGFGLAALLITSAFASIVERTALFRIAPSGSFARLRGLRPANWGAALGHAGLGVTIAGISGMTLAQQRIVLLHPGQSLAMAGYTWTLDKVGGETGPNYSARVSTVTVSRDGHVITTMHPARRTFPVAGVTTADVAIHTNGLTDLYVAMGDERNGGAVLRLHDNRFAPWIWFGGIIMAFGGILSLFDRRSRVGAPARARIAAAIPAE